MLQIIKLEAYKYVKNIFGVIFGLVFPIMWTVIIGVAWGKETFYIPNVNKTVNVLDYCFPALMVMAILSFSVAAIPITLCSNRIDKRTKIIALANISKLQYIISLMLCYYIMYFIEFVIVLIIAITAFKLTTSIAMIMSLLFIPIVIFVLHFLISVSLANFCQTMTIISSVSLLFLMISLFFSGSTVSTYVVDPNNAWFKYIQYILPTGNAVLIINSIANQIDTSKIWWIYVTSSLYFGLFTFLAVKYFKWD
ncbi:ABC transporter permease [Spiroplasma tabanidicola]|uniref:ABC transporter permease n=1 Tax=Spiroplasma tabanidicola TaxID=324079 RepID=A0A6I6C5W9_9MOLU|nr:ABC transporter permease [Spiroplasma tabanidicola]QGS52297.1 ABC transporter permease [Spiroplasma tabanidicola]